MAAQQKFFNTLFVIVAALFCIIAVIQASPVAKLEEAEAQSPEAEGTVREGRFYGLGGSQASSFASANAGASGLGLGYPYGGGGVGLAQASAVASAGAGGIGYPYGK